MTLVVPEDDVYELVRSRHIEPCQQTTILTSLPILHDGVFSMEMYSMQSTSLCTTKLYYRPDGLFCQHWMDTATYRRFYCLETLLKHAFECCHPLRALELGQPSGFIDNNQFSQLLAGIERCPNLLHLDLWLEREHLVMLLSHTLTRCPQLKSLHLSIPTFDNFICPILALPLERLSIWIFYKWSIYTLNLRPLKHNQTLQKLRLLFPPSGVTLDTYTGFMAHLPPQLQELEVSSLPEPLPFNYMGSASLICCTIPWGPWDFKQLCSLHDRIVARQTHLLAWRTLALTLAFFRCNRGHPFSTMIMTLFPAILQLLPALPDPLGGLAVPADDLFAPYPFSKNKLNRFLDSKRLQNL